MTEAELNDDDVRRAVVLDSTNFPDDNFRAALAENYYIKEGDVFYPGKMTSMSVSGKEISDMTGLSYFVSLSSLGCDDNNLEELDVSDLKLLKALSCGSNHLKKLDLASNNALAYLDCSNNELEKLEISSLKELTHLNCKNAGLNRLDLASNNALDYLDCSDNELEELDVSNLKELKTLKCKNNHLKKLDITKNIKLDTLETGDNSITDFKLSDDVLPTYMYLGIQRVNINIEMLNDGTYLARSECLTEIDPGDSAVNLPYYGNYDFEAFRSGKKTDEGWLWNESPLPKRYSCGCKFFVYIVDTSDRKNAVEMQITFINNYEKFSDSTVELTEEMIPDNMFRDYLKKYYDEDGDNVVNVRDVLGISIFRSDGDDEIRNMKGVELFTELGSISLSNMTNLDEIDLSANEELVSVYFSKCGLRDLDLSLCKNLNSVYISDCDVRRLDLSACKNLNSVYISDCGVRRLDLSACEKLNSVEIRNCDLLELKLPEDIEKDNVHVSTRFIEATAVKRDGKWGLEILDDVDLNNEHIIKLNENPDVNGKVTWENEKDVPLYLSYVYLMSDDNTNLNDISEGRDCFSVRIQITNNAPPIQEGKQIEISEENFPDEGFRNYLKERWIYDSASNTIDTAYVTGLNIDFWDFDRYQIRNLKGIGQFNCLRSLSLRSLPINSIDLSGNESLTCIDIRNLPLADTEEADGLIISGCKYLDTLIISNSSLSKLDVSNNEYLRTLDVNEASLTEIDLSRNPGLNYLDLSNNVLLSIDLSNNKKLRYLDLSYQMNGLNSIEYGSKENIEYLYLQGNKLKSFDILPFKKLEGLGIDYSDGIKEIDLTGRNMKTLILGCLENTNTMKVIGDIGSMDRLESLRLIYTAFDNTSLNLSGCTSLQDFNFYEAGLENLDLSSCSKLVYINYMFPSTDSTLQHLNIRDCIDLISADVSNLSKLKSLDASGAISLRSLDCYNSFVEGELEDLLLEGCISLQSLYCYNNGLKNLDIKDNVALKYLNCAFNRIEEIDMSKNWALKYFVCNYNPIRRLGLTANNKAILQQLECINGALTSLNLKDAAELTYINVNDQKLVLDPEEIVSAPAGEAATGAASQKAEYEGEASTEGDGSAKAYIDLAKYGDFDPSRVSELSAGVATKRGIEFGSVSDIPERITYSYDVSNDYYLKDADKMNVEISFDEGNSDSEKSGESAGTDDKDVEVSPYTGKTITTDPISAEGSDTNMTISYKKAVYFTGKKLSGDQAKSLIKNVKLDPSYQDYIEIKKVVLKNAKNAYIDGAEGYDPSKAPTMVIVFGMNAKGKALSKSDKELYSRIGGYLKDLNRKLKNNPIKFDINPIPIDDSKANAKSFTVSTKKLTGLKLIKTGFNSDRAKGLKQGKDYEISSYDETSKILKIKGKGNYTGVVSVTVNNIK